MSPAYNGAPDARSPYTVRIARGSGLFADMRLLTTAWSDEPDAAARAERQCLSHLGPKRAHQVVLDAFIPRFVRSEPPNLWRTLRLLERADWGVERIRPLHLYAAIIAEPVLADVITEVVAPRYALGDTDLAVSDVARFLEAAPRNRFSNDRRWATPTIRRVAQGVMGTLRDLGVLGGSAKKQILPTRLPLPTFAILSRARYEAGARGMRLVRDPTWRCYGLEEGAIERMFIEAQQLGFLAYHASGSLVRVDYPLVVPAGAPSNHAEGDLERYAAALVERAD